MVAQCFSVVTGVATVGGRILPVSGRVVTFAPMSLFIASGQVAQCSEGALGVELTFRDEIQNYGKTFVEIFEKAFETLTKGAVATVSVVEFGGTLLISGAGCGHDATGEGERTALGGGRWEAGWELGEEDDRGEDDEVVTRFPHFWAGF